MKAAGHNHSLASSNPPFNETNLLQPRNNQCFSDGLLSTQVGNGSKDPEQSEAVDNDISSSEVAAPCTSAFMCLKGP